MDLHCVQYNLTPMNPGGPDV